MKKTLVLYGVLALLFAGCVAKKQPENEELKNEPVTVEEKAEPVEEKKVVKPKIAFTFYEIVPRKIEVFPYNRLYSTKLINDEKLKNSFYVEGRLIRIERIYDSEIGDKYGKIAGKNLIVSMDDLKISDEKKQ